MFVCNLAGSNDRQTVEGLEYEFPDPSADFQRAGTGQYMMLGGRAGNASSLQQPTAVSSGSIPSSSAPAFASGNAGQYSQGTSPTPLPRPSARLLYLTLFLGQGRLESVSPNVLTLWNIDRHLCPTPA
ncbi:hypothetical protein CLAIMM_14922 [Cladophialophora immunda]|nr:hypothetical protein CLAIMM_14922 [Cladophialophora immunda]